MAGQTPPLALPTITSDFCLQDFLLKYLGATVAVFLIIGPFFRGHMRPENTVHGRAQVCLWRCGWGRPIVADCS